MAKKEKKEKIEMSLFDITREINELEYSKKNRTKVLSKVTKYLMSIQKLKKVNQDEIDSLFVLLKDKLEESYWILYLRIYVNFYNLSDNNMIIHGLRKQLHSRLSDWHIELDSFQMAIENLDKSKGVGSLREFVDTLKLKNDIELHVCTEEFISVTLLMLLILVRQRFYYNHKQYLILVVKVFVEKFANVKKNKDFLNMSSISKSLESGNFSLKFQEMIYLYPDVSDRITKLENETLEKSDFINYKVNECNKLKDEIINLTDELNINRYKIKLVEQQLNNLNQELSEAYNRNDYNENMYSQQFQTLKTSLISRLRKDLELDIQGLEDIANNSSDKLKQMLQRRIDNIYEVIKKIGG